MTEARVVALAGNPNTGKSTVFNKLTGLNQHTGNWPGKTVSLAQGSYAYQGQLYEVVDLPGTYSLLASSPEEEIARDFICSAQAKVTVIVVDATCLERNLHLVLQIAQLTSEVVVCVNLMDEAKRRKIGIDLLQLEKELGVPVVPPTAIKGNGLPMLKDAIARVSSGTIQPEPKTLEIQPDNPAASFYAEAERIAANVTRTNSGSCTLTQRLDQVAISRHFGIPLMLGLLATILWITIRGANYPSELLARLFSSFEGGLSSLFLKFGSPSWLHDSLVYGLFRGLAWVVSVMLPPMAIFFPLFTLLEDFGYLPRLAFNLDTLFQRAGAHGKQSLTMAMGFGCNAAGVISARIIDSPRERLLAILTNNLVPCNGRFPMLIVMGSIMVGALVGTQIEGFLAVLVVLGALVISVLATLGVSRLLTTTILRGEPSFFILELPPYRRPQVGTVLVRSFLDRTLSVLIRAVLIAAPCGLITWFLANISVSGQTLFTHFSLWLEPLGKAMGLDGVILLAFILGLPANEIVLPIIFMGYLSQGTLIEVQGLQAIRDILTANGWTWLTALNFLLFAIFHWPCGTTLLTIKKETGSFKWTILAALLPTSLGVVLCLFVAKIASIL